MTTHASFDRGFAAGVLLMIGAQAVHWLLTPAAHPDVSSLRTALVVLQAVVGGGAALWLFASRRRIA